jgi:hypothetical protein
MTLTGCWAALAVERRLQYRIWPRGDCWEFRGPHDEHGYGRVNVNWERLKAHRFAYEMAKGAIPPGLMIDHLCRHHWCVRPSHLEAVTHVVNTLRGESRNAKNRRKTHCKRGHPFTVKNTYRVAKGRICRACHAMHERHRREGIRAGDL